MLLRSSRICVVVGKGTAERRQGACRLTSRCTGHGATRRAGDLPER